MSSHHDHNDQHVSESKPVSFGVPIILGLVTMLVILLFVSLGDPCHHGHEQCACKEECSKECMEACEKGDHSMHPEATATEGKTEEGVKEEAAATPEVKAEEAVKEGEKAAEPAKVTEEKAEEHKEGAKHE
ncbi:MAG: hypothetical protein JST26_03120 [Bacteroidetes bacterium]|nr:hypothetical protein [Bacteroidota bacterium]